LRNLRGGADELFDDGGRGHVGHGAHDAGGDERAKEWDRCAGRASSDRGRSPAAETPCERPPCVSRNADESKMNKRSKELDRLVAHHEAGHAVVALSLGQAFQRVTIEPDHPGSLGHVHQEWSKKFDPYMAGCDARSRRLVEGRVIILLAGRAAGKKLAGTRRGGWGSGSDHNYAIDCLLLLTGSPEELGPYYELLDVRARGYVKREWPAIKALAKTLLRERRLTYRKARKIYREVTHGEPVKVIPSAGTTGG
jgi:hypothetical protein